MTARDAARLLKLRATQLPEGYASHEGEPLVRLHTFPAPVLSVAAARAWVQLLERGIDDAEGAVEEWGEKKAREQLDAEPDCPPHRLQQWPEVA